MYPSGSWSGFWQQEGWGRQPMQAFELQFRHDTVSGGGFDVIGSFRILGEWESTNGAMHFVKKYDGAHTVLYSGKPDGEGGIVGTWQLQSSNSGYRGSFALRPNLAPSDRLEEVREIKPVKPK